MEALGMVETRGLLAAIEASDVMLKTAEVHLVNQEFIGGGLVATLMAGDVAAIQTAVDAAATAVKRLADDSLFVTDVIPRPDGMLDLIVNKPGPLPDPDDDPGKMTAITPAPQPDAPAVAVVQPEPTEAPEASAEAPAKDAAPQPEAPAADAKPLPEKPADGHLDDAYLLSIVADKAKAVSYLKDFKINELRNLAKRQPAFVRQQKNVYQLSKINLINKLIAYFQHDA